MGVLSVFKGVWGGCVYVFGGVWVCVCVFVCVWVGVCVCVYVILSVCTFNT